MVETLDEEFNIQIGLGDPRAPATSLWLMNRLAAGWLGQSRMSLATQICTAKADLTTSLWSRCSAASSD